MMIDKTKEFLRFRQILKSYNFNHYNIFLSRDKLLNIKKRLQLIYTILRRAICRRMSIPKDYTINDLENLCNEIEGKDFKELSKIHKKWIGY